MVQLERVKCLLISCSSCVFVFVVECRIQNFYDILDAASVCNRSLLDTISNAARFIVVFVIPILENVLVIETDDVRVVCE